MLASDECEASGVTCTLSEKLYAFSNIIVTTLFTIVNKNHYRELYSFYNKGYYQPATCFGPTRPSSVNIQNIEKVRKT